LLPPQYWDCWPCEGSREGNPYLSVAGEEDGDCGVSGYKDMGESGSGARKNGGYCREAVVTVCEVIVGSVVGYTLKTKYTNFSEIVGKRYRRLWRYFSDF
jgi:hypothetical protein